MSPAWLKTHKRGVEGFAQSRSVGLRRRVSKEQLMPAVALVTGGSRGIGQGITRCLLAQGFAVSILATRAQPVEVLADLRELGEVRYVRGSVAEPADHQRYLRDAVDTWGRLDVLVNNAGVGPTARDDILDAGVDSFDRVLGINLRGPYFLTQAFARAVIEHRGPLDESSTPVATVVNVSSISATTVSTDRGEYCVSKAGVAMATQLWAARLAPEGIVVYEVRPGIVATDMTAAATDKYDSLFASGLAPMPRWGRPGDVGAAVAMLVAGSTPYSTGEIFHVDGGLHIPRL
jgi:NAD(P)-dependent dehydrogenase (short-subunit alcohol dehydrogenase family)